MAEIFFNSGKSITVTETYLDVSIEIYEAKIDKYPFIELTIKELQLDETLTRMVEVDKDIKLNINQIVWFK